MVMHIYKLCLDVRYADTASLSLIWYKSLWEYPVEHNLLAYKPPRG